MNSSENRENKRKLEELEQEINRSAINDFVNKIESVRPHFESKNYQQIANGLNSMRVWFDGLSSTGKVVVGGVGVILAFSAINTLLWTVSLLLKIAVFSVILYMLSKFFISKSSSS